MARWVRLHSSKTGGVKNSKGAGDSEVVPVSNSKPTVTTTIATDSPPDRLTPTALASTTKGSDTHTSSTNHSSTLHGDAGVDAELPGRQWIETTVDKLLKVREEKRFRMSVPGRDITIRTQVQRLAKFLLWSDPFVKTAVSTQPYPALAWSGFSLLTSGTTKNEAMLQDFNAISDLQVYWKVCEKSYVRSTHRGIIRISLSPSPFCILTCWNTRPLSIAISPKPKKSNKLDEIYRIRYLPIGEQDELRKNRDSLLKGPRHGKFVLSRSVVDEGQLCALTTNIVTDSTILLSAGTVPYFIFKDVGDGPMDGAQVLCAILHPLFTSSSQVGGKYAFPLHKENGLSLTNISSVLWEILVTCVVCSDAEVTICVLDALDECNEESRRKIIWTLEAFYSANQRLPSSSKLKFLATSCPYTNIEQSFQRFPGTAAYLHFDGDDRSEQIGREIDLVINARVRDVAGVYTIDDQHRISKRLKRMQNCTYLWLHFSFDIIEKSPTDYGRRSDIEGLFPNLPSEVSKTYKKILPKVQIPCGGDSSSTSSHCCTASFPLTR
ncbi:uncharacterized protein BDW43DRAFT_305923 [Aspergillus alliaceus]|uniref:uncharacterized protein n=1 Tax=Petromyces alliaceus TaxID=209559 RepID=UPI0012A4BEFE|nr:uncharacterized protein BDW43DRAFT_305923 [Aspergillus alliaceus]KAB8239038.1 hypothetical protein BDW43DRAFT_305923 [Aspergillus alliaceus]